MTSEERLLQLKKIDRLDKIIVRLEWIIVLICILGGTICATVILSTSRT